MLVLEKGASSLWQGEVCLTGGLPDLRKALQQDLQGGGGQPNHMNTNQEQVRRMQRGRMPAATGSRWERGTVPLWGVTDSRWAGGAGEPSSPHPCQILAGIRGTQLLKGPLLIQRIPSETPYPFST